MSDVYNTVMTQVTTELNSLGDMLLQRLNALTDAQTLEGNSFEDIMEMISATAGLTVAEVQTGLTDLIADLANVPRDKATAVTIHDSANDNAIVTPYSAALLIAKFWEDQVGMLPETKNEIQEIVALVDNNSTVIEAIQTSAANKATKTELADAVTQLQGEIAASVVEAATQAETDAGTIDNKYISPKTLVTYVTAIRGEIEADVNAALSALATGINGITTKITPPVV